MQVDEIKAILENNGYSIDSDIISRINIMLESIRDDNQINKLDDIINWFYKKREESDMIVEEIGINDLDKWNVDSETGNVKHESGGFFEVIGIKWQVVAIFFAHSSSCSIEQISKYSASNAVPSPLPNSRILLPLSNVDFRNFKISKGSIQSRLPFDSSPESVKRCCSILPSPIWLLQTPVIDSSYYLLRILHYTKVDYL